MRALKPSSTGRQLHPAVVREDAHERARVSESSVPGGARAAPGGRARHGRDVLPADVDIEVQQRAQREGQHALAQPRAAAARLGQRQAAAQAQAGRAGAQRAHAQLLAQRRQQQRARRRRRRQHLVRRPRPPVRCRLPVENLP
jgi:hypothetical protein